MTRNKVKLAWIVNENARISSFRKRSKSLRKKMRELTTLCDLSAFLIIYGPDSIQPELVWPDPPRLEKLVARYQSMPEVERWKKMTNQESYLKEKAARMQEQIRKIIKQNHELSANQVLHQIIQQGKPLLAFEDDDLSNLVFSLVERMKEVRKRIVYFERQDSSGTVDEEEGGFSESLWYKDFGKQMENNEGLGTSVRSVMGLPPNSYFGSFVEANDSAGLADSWNFDNLLEGSKTYASLGNQSYGESNMSLPKIGNDNIDWPFGIWGVRDDGSEKWLPQLNHGGTTNSNVEGESGASYEGLPLGQLGDGNVGTDAGFPYDGPKTWQNASLFP